VLLEPMYLSFPLQSDSSPTGTEAVHGVNWIAAVPPS